MYVWMEGGTDGGTEGRTDLCNSECNSECNQGKKHQWVQQSNKSTAKPMEKHTTRKGDIERESEIDR